jgi:hypothetical protein
MRDCKNCKSCEVYDWCTLSMKKTKEQIEQDEDDIFNLLQGMNELMR